MSDERTPKSAGERIASGAIMALAIAALLAITASATRSAFFPSTLVRGSASTLIMHIERLGDDRIDDFRRVLRFDQTSQTQCMADMPGLLAEVRKMFKGMTVTMACIPGGER